MFPPCVGFCLLTPRIARKLTPCKQRCPATVSAQRRLHQLTHPTRQHRRHITTHATIESVQHAEKQARTRINKHARHHTPSRATRSATTVSTPASVTLTTPHSPSTRHKPDKSTTINAPLSTNAIASKTTHANDGRQGIRRRWAAGNSQTQGNPQGARAPGASTNSHRLLLVFVAHQNNLNGPIRFR